MGDLSRPHSLILINTLKVLFDRIFNHYSEKYSLNQIKLVQSWNAVASLLHLGRKKPNYSHFATLPRIYSLKPNSVDLEEVKGNENNCIQIVTACNVEFISPRNSTSLEL